MAMILRLLQNSGIELKKTQLAVDKQARIVEICRIDRHLGPDGNLGHYDLLDREEHGCVGLRM
jgi:hypothetical protein